MGMDRIWFAFYKELCGCRMESGWKPTATCAEWGGSLYRGPVSGHWWIVEIWKCRHRGLGWLVGRGGEAWRKEFTRVPGGDCGSTRKRTSQLTCLSYTAWGRFVRFHFITRDNSVGSNCCIFRRKVDFWIRGPTSVCQWTVLGRGLQTQTVPAPVGSSDTSLPCQPANIRSPWLLTFGPGLPSSCSPAWALHFAPGARTTAALVCWAAVWCENREPQWGLWVVPAPSRWPRYFTF